VSGPLSWRAIGYGVGVTLAVTFALILVGFFIGPMMEIVGVAAVSWGMRLAGLAGDFAAGLVAGRLAGRDGAVHGAIAGAIGTSVGLAFSRVRLAVPGIELPFDWWLQVVLWSLVGLALSFVGGALGAQRGAR
jgi:hypothetical protein